MMKRQFNRMRQQLSHPNATIRAQEATELLSEDLLQIEQRIEPAKRAAHSVSKRLQACLQGQCGSEMDKRVKKLPLMALSMAMAESFKELDTESSLGKALEMGCCIQSSLAKIVAEFEIDLEHYVLQPLNKLSEEELPTILKRKKTLQKLISDWNTIKSRLNQAAKSSSNSTGAGAGPGASSAANKLEILKEEEEEVKRKVEQCKDEYMADLYHFSTKEDIYASYFIKLLEIQAQYHRQSLESLDSALAELRESHRQTEPSFTTDTPVAGYYGVSLETHLRSLGREIALPIEACVMMLLASGMKEEGLFRLAAGASVLRKLKSSLASGSNALEEFYSDPHAVAGALKSYLRELPQPLMTFELYDEWVKAASLKDIDSHVQSLRATCSRLPQDSYNNLRDPMQLDLASVSSIQAVVEALIQNVDTLFPGEVDFNVSGMFMPPTNTGLSKAVPEEEPTPATPPASTPTLLDGEATSRDPEARSQPASPGLPRPSPEAAGPPAPVMTDNTTRKGQELGKEQFVRPAVCSPLYPLETPQWRGAQPTSAFFPGKRPAPARPAAPPPRVAQPRSSAPAPAASPKALPRRTAPSRAPSVPPPLPPQPAPRHSRDALGSPKPSSGEADAAAAVDCVPGTTEEGQPLPAGGSPLATLAPEGQPTEN
ncbi:SH3 domain-binding protein 1 isoform X9 [Haemorhous mexicanus]|uniref:SH3 domain-binding protein 1 isoform X9 n=1 Tax=Haemorhous mexicanus TaxID=30427 RepID=UPI0028BE22D1|nr:SH3 domain-binding protein 1 isoform X9 [Haemorhous mexicanus]